MKREKSHIKAFLPYYISDRKAVDKRSKERSFAKWVHKIAPFPLGNLMERIRGMTEGNALRPRNGGGRQAPDHRRAVQGPESVQGHGHPAGPEKFLPVPEPGDHQGKRM